MSFRSLTPPRNAAWLAAVLSLIPARLPALAPEKMPSTAAEVRELFVKTVGGTRGCRGEFSNRLEQAGRRAEQTYLFRLLRPNYGDVRILVEGREIGILRSDGREMFSVTHRPGEIVRSAAGGSGAGLALAAGPLSPIRAFLRPEEYLAPAGLRLVAEEVVDAETCWILEAPARRSETTRYWIGRSGWLRRVERRVPGSAGGARVQTIQVARMRPDATLKPEGFAYVPPAGYEDRTPRPASK